MRLARIAAIFVTVVTMALLLVAVPSAQGAPSADGALSNSSFDGDYVKSTVYQEWFGVPQAWTPWYNEGGSHECGAGNPQPYKLPHLEPELDPRFVKEGTTSARMWIGYGIIDGGFYQTVAATAGTTYQFSAWAYLWSPEDEKHGHPGDSSGSDMSFQVGIDPGGGTNAGGGVRWSGGSKTMDAFSQQSVSATATGNTITVFVRATAYWCVFRNDARFDAASLSVTASGPAPTAAGGGGGGGAKPTKAPSGTWGAKVGTIETATPGADGSIVHTVGSGQTCIGIADAYGIDLETLEKQNNLTNASCRNIYVGLKLIIKPAGKGGGSDATSEATDAATEAPTAEPTQVAEALGTICVLGYNDKNANGSREPGEPMMAGMTFTVNDATAPVTNWTSDGVTQNKCFPQLKPGNYTVSWAGEGLSPSGDQSWPVTLAGGATAAHEFGATSGGSTTNGGSGGNNQSSGGGSGGEGLPTWAIALIGAFGVILFMGGLGVAGYFLLLRRTNI